ncbi:hypothetical protein ACOME3_002591 [Neoechinorhynchus agilis]
MKFQYFGVRGRGEITRLIAAAANVKYENAVVNLKEWSELKSSTPLGQLPLLTLDDGTVLPQSLSIARYLATEHGLAGGSCFESAKIDAVVDTALDGNIVYGEVKYDFKGEEQEREIAKFKNNTIPLVLKRLEKLKSMYGSSKYMVGTKLSWADLYVFDTLENFEEYDKEEVAKHEKLLAVREAVKENEGISAYLATRKPDEI